MWTRTQSPWLKTDKPPACHSMHNPRPGLDAHLHGFKEGSYTYTTCCTAQPTPGRQRGRSRSAPISLYDETVDIIDGYWHGIATFMYIYIIHTYCTDPRCHNNAW